MPGLILVSMALDLNVRALETLLENLSGATSTKDKVRIANRIYDTMSLFEMTVEECVKGAMDSNGGAKNRPPTPVVTPPQYPNIAAAKKYRNMKLADIGRSLLQERGVLHGKEIERLAKDGGFKSENRSNFQSYLAVAFSRAGGFQNIGKNQWRLNPGVPALDRKSDPSTNVNGNHPNGPISDNGVPRKIQLHNWLKQHGPATRAEVLKGSGLPEGTASSYLSISKDLFQIRDGKWHAL